MAGVQNIEELENILQCPVCFEIPKSAPIHQCDRGHHLCESCFLKLRDRSCPICKGLFYRTRNFIAEELIKIFPRLRKALASAPVPSNQTNETKVRKKLRPSFCRGKFPCLFESCNRNFGAGTMLRHIRDEHNDFLREVAATNKHTDEWEFYGIMNLNHTEAIQVANMGLFFVVFEINRKGIMKAAVQMVASEEVSSMFKFKFKIMDVERETKISLKNRVVSCYDRLSDLAQNGYCLDVDTNKFSFLEHDATFFCSVSIIDGRQ